MTKLVCQGYLNLASVFSVGCLNQRSFSKNNGYVEWVVMVGSDKTQMSSIRTQKTITGNMIMITLVNWKFGVQTA
jgi:hypothetical protein